MVGRGGIWWLPFSLGKCIKYVKVKERWGRRMRQKSQEGLQKVVNAWKSLQFENSQKDSLVKWVRRNSYQHQYALFAATPRPYLLSKLIAFITHPGIGHEVLKSSWPTLHVNFSSTLCIQTPNLPVP